MFASPSHSPFSGTEEDEHQVRTLLLGIESQQSMVENFVFNFFKENFQTHIKRE